MAKRTHLRCTVEGCRKPHDAKGFCHNHYRRFRRWGDPLGQKPDTTLDDFEARIDRTDGCWNWVGSTSPQGYGTFKHTLAHRFAYQLANGEIPLAHEIHHECRNRRCVNPAHLRAVTSKEHARIEPRNPLGGAVNPPKTHCVHGHAYTPENTYMHPTAGRTCRTCKRERDEVYFRRNKDELNRRRRIRRAGGGGVAGGGLGLLTPGERR